MENDRLTRGAIRFGAFELDLRAGELRKQGLKIKLQEQPFQILAMLLERPGQVVTRVRPRLRGGGRLNKRRHRRLQLPCGLRRGCSKVGVRLLRCSIKILLKGCAS
jgi:hypothetical protein